MTAMLARELDTIARCRALGVAIVLHATLLIAFALAWGNGRGVSAGFHDQAQAVEALMLSLLLPWTAARCMAAERGDDLVLLSAATGIRPSGIVLARAAAVVLALGVVVLSGLPVLVMAARISGAPASAAAIGETAHLALASVACGAVLVCRHRWSARATGWLVATIATALLAIACRLLSPLAAAALLTTCGVGAVWILAVRADTSLRYLAEQHA